MNALSKRTLLVLIVFSIFVFSKETVGLPSGGRYPPKFTFNDGYWYDSWGFNRNYYGDRDGYMPNIAYETLGTNKESAYSIGERFKTDYESKVQRAEAILKYVQRWTQYGYDVDNVVMNGIPQEEWAWNADEMANMFNTTTNTVAVGDCEDMAFLCATIYIGAEYDVSMVLAPSHVALLIWLPEYPNANYYWDIPNDGRGKGWIWVEATGERNPLGWTPPDFKNGHWTAYPLGLMISNVNYTPHYPKADDSVTVASSVISAKASVSQVSLKYSINGGTYTTLTMMPKGSIYEAIIPKQPKDTTVDFYISAADTDGNTRESDHFSYTIGESSWSIDLDRLLWNIPIVGNIVRFFDTIVPGFGSLLFILLMIVTGALIIAALKR